MILFAVVIGLVLYGLAAPDRGTLSLTRGAAGAVRASIGSGGRTRSATRSTRPDRTQSGRRRDPIQSTRPRSGGRSTRSMKPDPTRPDRVGPRSPSRIARAIDGWIDGADGATQRRGEAAAALRRLRDRARDRKAVKQVAAAWDEAHDENGRRDRAQQRARISAGAQAIAVHDPNGALMPEPTGREQLDQQVNGLASKLVGFPVVLKPRDQRRPKKPATDTPRKVPAMPDITRADFTHPITTELDHLTAAQAEAGAAYVLAEQIWHATRELNAWLLAFPERYYGATDLVKNGQMNAAVALLRERQLGSTEIEVGKVNSQLGLFMRGILNLQQKVKESDAQSGRVESATTK